jgi:hypothetical protein
VVPPLAVQVEWAEQRVEPARWPPLPPRNIIKTSRFHATKNICWQSSC